MTNPGRHRFWRPESFAPLILNIAKEIGWIVRGNSVISAIVVVLVLVTGAGTAAADHGGPRHGDAAVSKPNEQLTTKWWQTYMGISSDGAFDRCDLGHGRVVFLAGTTGGPAVRSCTIPANGSVLVPLINFECSAAENGVSSFAKLKVCTDEVVRDFTDLLLIVDGVLIRRPIGLRVQSHLFHFTAVVGNPFGIDPAVRTPSVSDGYWALIGPFREGVHTVSFGGSYPPAEFMTRADYTLTVRSGR